MLFYFKFLISGMLHGKKQNESSEVLITEVLLIKSVIKTIMTELLIIKLFTNETICVKINQALWLVPLKKFVSYEYSFN